MGTGFYTPEVLEEFRRKRDEKRKKHLAYVNAQNLKKRTLIRAKAQLEALADYHLRTLKGQKIDDTQETVVVKANDVKPRPPEPTNGDVPTTTNGKRKKLEELLTMEDVELAIEVLRLCLRDGDKEIAKYIIDQKFGQASKRTEVTGANGEPMNLLLYLPQKGSFRPDPQEEKTE